MADENRFFKRFNLYQIIDMGMDGEKFFTAEGIDISLGGINCKSSYSVDPLAKVYLIIKIPKGDENYEIKTEGIVIRTEKDGNNYLFGVKFVDLMDKDLLVLSEYLANYKE